MQQQVISAIRFSPAAPLWLLAMLAVLCAAAVAFALWRRASGAVWRGLAFAVLLGWLCGPRTVRETRLPLSDIAVLAIDQTASMTVGGRAAQAGAVRAAMEAEGRRTPGLELRTVVVPESAHDGTRLFETLERTLSTIPADRLAGVLAVTDGQVHDAPAAWSHGVPLHLLLTGNEGELDRRVRLLQAPEFGVVGKSVTLRAVVEDLGAAPSDQPATLTIRRDGEPPRIESVPVGEPHDIDIPITREGPSAVELTVNELPGEVSPANNRVVAQVNGVRDRLRVLLVSGEPHAGERTWRRLLKADPAVDLVHFTILRPPDKDDATPLTELALIAFPTRELFQQKIGEFDLIILDRFQNRGILAQPYVRNIADYVRRGGALLVSVGPEFASPLSLDDSPLQDVLPAHPLRDADGQTNADAVINGTFRPEVTPLGRRHPVTATLSSVGAEAGGGAAGGAWGSWYRYVAADGAHGQVLMTAGGASPDASPLLVLDRVEKGRVALLLSDQIWLWSRGHQGGGPQAELLRRVTHWLLRQPALEEESLTGAVSSGPDHGSITWTRTSIENGPSPPLGITAPDGVRSELAMQETGPGQSAVTLPVNEPGVWQASDGTHTAFAAVGVGDAAEFADLRASAGPLGGLTRDSGGGVYWLTGRDGHAGPSSMPTLRRVSAGQPTSGRDWVGLPRRDAHVTTGVASVPLLPDWFALLLILALVITAWWREAA